MDANRMTRLLKEAVESTGGITVLTGAGISAESGIPTFRGPEGYWTVGSRIYQPQDMATLKMFQQNPREVWQWYLYRMGVCRQANPNSGHMALIALESLFPDRFTLVTQNVDNLHLRAGHRQHNTFQIHGNIFFFRCSKSCSSKIDPIPKEIHPKGKNDRVTRTEWQLLHCPDCGGLMRPHVLWFDETYNERYYHLESTLEAAHNTELLIVAGTSGATNLPNQVVWEVYRHGGIIIDINIDTNPFSRLADSYHRGASIRQPSSQALPWMIDCLKAIVTNEIYGRISI
jgi:NAD-dependent deacetylase